ncbi:MAG: glycosyltransferase family 2 protein, partial [Rhodospirillaceae bacterium]|nr:glycosyltransferase family 2 protein [Rhodospirillales bacterium]
MSQTRPVLSLVVPMFNESGNVDRLFARLAEVMAGLDVTYEIVCVDDGSRDDTVALVVDHHGRDPRIKMVELSRNFGKELALTAGLKHSTGQAVIMIDADLQHPPELIAIMLEKWRKGYEMVIAVRRSRDDESAFKRAGARAFYSLFAKV